MYCKKCGAELKEGQTFCPKCGSKIEIKEKPKKKTREKTTNKGKKIIAIVCCLVLIVSGTIVGLYFANKENINLNNDNNYVALEAGFTDVKITDEASALQAIESVADVIGIEENIQKELKISRTDTIGDNTYYRFQQYYNDIPVYGKTISLAVRNNDVSALVSNYESLNTTLEYSITEEEAKKIVKDKFSVEDEDIISYGKYIYEREGSYMFLTPIISKDEIYETGISFVSGKNKTIHTISTTYYSDLIEYNKRLKGQKDEQYFDVYNDDSNYYLSDTNRQINGYETESDNYWLLFSKVKDVKPISWSKLDNLNKPSAVDAVANVKKAYDYYELEHNYKSPNGNGTCQINVVDGFGFSNDKNYTYDNANSKSYIDKDGNNYTQINIGKKTISEKYTMSAYLDVIAHEYTHAVVYYTASLGGNKASESLNEAYSDIMGEVIENYITNKNDWIIGNNIRNIQNTKLKSVSNYSAKKDAHENAQIVDYVAYLMNNGCNGNKTSIDMKTIGTLWFNSLFLLPSDATFSQCRNAVELSARIMLRNGELTQEQYNCVSEAFDEVGIDNSAYSYRYRVKNDFSLKVLSEQKNDNVNFNLKIYKKSDNPLLDFIKLDKNKELVLDENSLYGNKEIHLDDSMYILEVTDLDKQSTNSNTIITKIIVQGDNEKAVDEVVIHTDFSDITTVVLNKDYEDIYYKYINDNIDEFKGYCGEYEETFDFSDVPENDIYFRIKDLKGISSAFIKDLNNDDIPEMVTVSMLGKGSAKGTDYYEDSIMVDIHCYSLDENNNVVDCGSTCNINTFKNADEQSYVYYIDGKEPRICVSGNYWPSTSSAASILGQKFTVYEFNNKLIEKESVLYHFSHGNESYTINDSETDYDSANAKADEVFKSLGIEGLSINSGWNKFPNNAEKICTFGTKYNDDNSFKVFIDDFSDLQNHINKSRSKIVLSSILGKTLDEAKNICGSDYENPDYESNLMEYNLGGCGPINGVVYDNHNFKGVIGVYKDNENFYPNIVSYILTSNNKQCYAKIDNKFATDNTYAQLLDLGLNKVRYEDELSHYYYTQYQNADYIITYMWENEPNKNDVADWVDIDIPIDNSQS